jgi:hypothetical protein
MPPERIMVAGEDDASIDSIANEWNNRSLFPAISPTQTPPSTSLDFSGVL